MYLSTTDYVQHKAAPGSELADAFYAMVDRYVGALDAAGAVVVLTADHGMNDKHLADGWPDALYLQDVVDKLIGAGAARVILPITDPYVAHHGALGSFATIYLPTGRRPRRVVAALAAEPGVEAAMEREEACARFELPPDRVGDVVVLSGRHKVLGTTAARHDLSGLDRAAALARRPVGAARADDRQPPPRRPDARAAAQFRRLRRRPQPDRPMNVPAALPFRREAMRVAGKLVETGETIDVLNPYTNAVVGTVPAARPEHVRDAFAKAKAFKPRLTRFERQPPADDGGAAATAGNVRAPDHRRVGPVLEDLLYEASRAYDVWSFAAQLVIRDDGEILPRRHPNGKMRKYSVPCASCRWG